MNTRQLVKELVQKVMEQDTKDLEADIRQYATGSHSTSDVLSRLSQQYGTPTSMLYSLYGMNNEGELYNAIDSIIGG